MTDLGYVTVDRLTLRDAEERALADACSAVIRHAEIETASARARRLAAHSSARVVRFQAKAQWRAQVEG